MMKYGNYDIDLTFNCTNSGVHWCLVVQYLILSSAKMVIIGSGDGLFPIPYQVITQPDVFRVDWYHWIQCTKYQAICKYRLRYMKQCWLIRIYNFYWHMNQYTAFSINKINFKMTSAEWNCSFQRNWRFLSSMEFHGIPWNCSCQRNWRILSSTEFHGTASCQRNWRTQSSMEFHGTSHVSEIGALEVPRYSMEFHGTALVSEIGALLVPWNSMEFHGSARVSEIGAF